MHALLLPIIYLAFISLGLPDSALGSAWPSMYEGLGAGVSWVGAVTAIISAGTIVSSVFSVNVVRRLGTARTTAGSVALTAAALIGFATCGEFWQLCLWAVPYGLGAGAVDAALNSYVAIHYASRHLSWLHCMWGVGASAGPVIMAWRLAGGTWNDGFLTIGAIQVVIAVVMVLSMPLWKRGASEGSAADARNAAATKSRRELLSMPGVREILICFFCYCALEATCGNWAASYCSLVRQTSVEEAASWASLFYIGITVGRAVSGFLTWRLSDRGLIRLGQGFICAGIVLIAAPLPNVCAMVGLVVVGLGCAPVYPSIIHCTPTYFGHEFALALTGMQMAFASVGSLVMSPLFGVLAQWVSPALYPVYLAALLGLMVLMSEALNRKVAVRQKTHR